MSLNFDRARFNMVEQQVRPWEVLDPRVLDVLQEVKREDFVPSRYRKLAFADLALPLDHGQSMLKPVVEGRLLQALDVQPDDEVLVVGTGSGFISACLARLGRMVTSLERIPELAERARSKLEQAGIRNCRVLDADVFHYTPETAFDAIAVTGAVATLDPRFGRWLAPGGRLFVVRGHAPAMTASLLTRIGAEHYREDSLFETELGYLHGAEPKRRFTL